MASFRGRYDYQLDAKGRVNIPAKFRKALSPEAEETFIIVRAPGGCLRAYPKDVWEQNEAKLAALPPTAESDRLKREIFGSLIDSTLDVQGRVSLSAGLMAKAGIKKEVTLVGTLSYIELWDSARYEECTSSDEDFDAAFYSVEARMAGL